MNSYISAFIESSLEIMREDARELPYKIADYIYDTASDSADFSSLTNLETIEEINKSLAAIDSIFPGKSAFFLGIENREKARVFVCFGVCEPGTQEEAMREMIKKECSQENTKRMVINKP